MDCYRGITNLGITIALFLFLNNKIDNLTKEVRKGFADFGIKIAVDEERLNLTIKKVDAVEVNIKSVTDKV